MSTIEHDREFERILDASAIGRTCPPVPVPVVRGVLRRCYHLGGTLTRVATEKDDTFVLDAQPAGTRYVVKVASSFEDPEVVDLQSAVLEHAAARASGVPLPRLVRTIGGERAVPVPADAGPSLADAGPSPRDAGPFPRTLRVLTWVAGTPIGARVPTPAQFERVGEHLARLSLALRDLEHPRADRVLLWDLRSLTHLRPLLGYARDPELRTLATAVFDAFDEHVLPLLPGCEHQVVHGDFNAFNVLVDDGDRRYVTGVIDFGDVTRTAVPLDVAVAVGSHLGSTRPDPWLGGAHLLAGYLRVRPLTARDVDVIAWAAPARLVLRALVTDFARATSPERGRYLSGHANSDLARIRAVVASAPDVVRRRLHALVPG